MLGNASVAPTLPAVDMERAKRFYQEKLGLTVVHETPAGTAFTAGNGTSLFIYPRRATKADHTAAAFQFTDSAAFDAAVKGLRERGVVFEEYDSPRLKTVDGIATTGPVKGAWFKDTEGNILSVVYTG